MKLDDILFEDDKDLYRNFNLEAKGFRPNLLYRYCGVHEIDRLLQYAVAKTIPRIFLSNPLKFNDPYDSWMPGIRLDSEPINVETVKGKLSLIGVASFSSLSDSILMWGHYSDKHKGVCLEYSINDIEYMLSKNLKTTYLVKVIYLKGNTASRFKLGHPEEMSYGEHGMNDFFEMVAGKEKSWCYEKEWRIVRRLTVNSYGSYDRHRYVKLMPRKIILGAAAGDEEIAKIKYVSKYLKIQVEKMKIDENDYKLVRVPFDTESNDKNIDYVPKIFDEGENRRLKK